MRALTLLAVGVLLAGCGERSPASAPSAASPSEPAVAGSAAAPGARPEVAPALTPEGYGPLRIGMTRAEVVQAMGEDSDPEAVGGPDPENCDEFRPARAPQGLLVMIEQGRLTRISLVQGSTVKTARGFGLGDAAAAVKTAYGADARSQPHQYVAAPAEYVSVWSAGGGAGDVQDPSARGLVYEVGGDGRVTAVRAGGLSIQYVEGCA